MPLRLSVLDQSPISEGMTGSQALRNTIDLAQLTDALGYHRYWVAEHHGGPMLAGPSPEALIGPIASATRADPRRQRRRDAPALLAVQGRRDLQPARRPLPRADRPRAGPRGRHRPDDHPRAPARPLAARCPTTSRSNSPSCSPTSRARSRVSSPLARLAKVLPGRPETPEPWLLGSSPQSAVWAGELGLPYAFADFINSNGAEIADLYRRGFADGVRLDAPQTAVAVWGLAADTEEEAVKLATSSRMAFTMLRRGRLIAVPPPETAARFLASEGDEVAMRRRTIVGTAAQVRAGIEEAAAEYGAGEVIVVTITYDHGARRRSYELIAEEFGLAAGDLAEAGRQTGT